MDCFQSIKQLGFHSQDQESSSTQSTGQSSLEKASVENEKYGKNVMSIQPGKLIIFCFLVLLKSLCVF